jgi:hypothetical protein
LRCQGKLIEAQCVVNTLEEHIKLLSDNLTKYQKLKEML